MYKIYSAYIHQLISECKLIILTVIYISQKQNTANLMDNHVYMDNVITSLSLVFAKKITWDLIAMNECVSYIIYIIYVCVYRNTSIIY